MVQLQGFQVTVTVDGQDLEEYIDPDAEQDSDDEADDHNGDTESHADRYVERYIEAKTGSTYCIKHRAISEQFLRHSPGIVVNAVVDGVDIHHGWIYQKWPYEGKFRGNWYRKSGVAYEEPFVFGEAKISDTAANRDEDTQAKLKARALGLGTIEIKICRAISFKDAVIPSRDSAAPGAQEKNSIHEKLLKGRAVSHQTTFGPPTVSTAGRTYHTVYQDTTDKPFLHFKFHYMSRGTWQNPSLEAADRKPASLQIMGLIPRSPSPEEAEDGVEVPLENMTREQLLQLANQQQATILRQEKLKREATAGPSVKRERLIDDDPDLSVTSTRSVRARKSGPITIDLTDD